MYTEPKETTHETLVQWYPGHMAKGFKEIQNSAALADVFIVVLDARAPISSYNEDFDKIAPHKPRLFIFTKIDLMDKNKKNQINERFSGEHLLWLDLRNQSSKNKILRKLTEINKEKISRNFEKGIIKTKIKSFVVGVPNCGKSTLINLVTEKASLKVENFPGVTKEKKWVANKEFLFLDTPGILLPKFDDQEPAVKLLAIGSIKYENFSPQFLATKFYVLLSKYYPEKLEKLGLKPSLDEIEVYGLLSDYAKKFNFFKSQGKLDLTKAYNHFVQMVRNLKGITFD